MIIQTYFSMSFSHYFMRCYQDKACLVDYVVNSCAGVQQRTVVNGEKHFHRHYGATDNVRDSHILNMRAVICVSI